MVRANQLDNALEKPRVGGRASSTCLWTREFPNCSPCSCTTDQSAAELDTARVIDNVSTRQTRQTRVDLLCTFRCSCESSKHTFRIMSPVVAAASATRPPSSFGICRLVARLSFSRICLRPRAREPCHSARKTTSIFDTRGLRCQNQLTSDASAPMPSLQEHLLQR